MDREPQAVVAEAPAHPAATAAALKAGELYDNALSHAWAGDSNSIGFLAAYTPLADFQRRPTREQHVAVLVALLQHVGDTIFAGGLRHETPETRTAVIGALRGAKPTLLDAYPLTAGLR